MMVLVIGEWPGPAGLWIYFNYGKIKRWNRHETGETPKGNAMSRFITLSGLFILLLLVAAGCSDDPVTPSPGDDPSVRVDLEPGAGDFTIKLESVTTPDRTMRGPFFLRGTNLHYDDAVGALVVDLTITNNSPVTFENPVNITFLRLIPEGTIILNSPDDGPTFEFGFENDDLWWTPGEKSLPLTVMFQADPGVSVGFNAHISVGGVHEEGIISGFVWHDTNKNGLRDEGEPGIPDIMIDIDDGTDREILRRAITDRRGYFAYSHLDAGTYEVRVMNPPREMSSTTPINMHVLLTQNPGGGVSTFTEADFGFARDDFLLPGPKLVVGGTFMDRWIVYQGESVMDLGLPPGVPVAFRWEGFADRGLEIRAYRWGWDVSDAHDPNDPGWMVAPGIGPEHQAAMWERPLEPGSMHSLVIQCWDTEEHLIRATIQFQVDAPDSVGAF